MIPDRPRFSTAFPRPVACTLPAFTRSNRTSLNCPPVGFSGDRFAPVTGFHAFPSQYSTSYFVGGRSEN